MGTGFNQVRAQHYNSLHWATDELYLKKFLDFADLQLGDTILDLGTGTALVARGVVGKVEKVVGLDNAVEMLKIATQANPEITFVLGDARQMPFVEKSFDKVLARMVFHHLTEGLELALGECWRVLRRQGTLVISEGVPPCSEVKPEYIEIFRLKEERLTFLPEDLINFLKQSGFVNISYKFYLLPKVSVKDWLKNSGCSRFVQEKILQLHLNGSRLFKKAYNLVGAEDDCLIDMLFFMAKGERP